MHPPFKGVEAMEHQERLINIQARRYTDTVRYLLSDQFEASLKTVDAVVLPACH